MKGAIPLSANTSGGGATEGLGVGGHRGERGGKQDASTEQKYSEGEGREVERDWIYAAVRLIQFRLA